MKINYKQPYWMKFTWEIDEHPDDQYVTEYNKKLNETFDEFFYEDEFSIHIDFRIEEDFLLDENFMLFGKPSKNIGLVYSQKENHLFFIYRIKGENDKIISVPNIQIDELKTGISVTIIRKKNKFIIYKNLEEVGYQEFEGNLCDNHRDTAFYLGCSSNSLNNSPENKWYGEMDIKTFFILENISDIETVRLYVNNPVFKFPTYNTYANLLCYYDFNISNNLGIIYDESSNKNFLELIK
jgi:hypothetical protein